MNARLKRLADALDLHARDLLVGLGLFVGGLAADGPSVASMTVRGVLLVYGLWGFCGAVGRVVDSFFAATPLEDEHLLDMARTFHRHMVNFAPTGVDLLLVDKGRTRGIVRVIPGPNPDLADPAFEVMARSADNGFSVFRDEQPPVTCLVYKGRHAVVVADFLQQLPAMLEHAGRHGWPAPPHINEELCRLRAQNEALLDTVQWMTGSPDFAPGGDAERGWAVAKEKLWNAGIKHFGTPDVEETH